MTSKRLQEVGTPPAEFNQQVKDALEHLYDFRYLQSHPLGPGDHTMMPGDGGEMAGQHLKSELIAAVEELSPGPGVPFRSPHARLYTLLQLRYVEGLTIHEAARMLSISERQAYRDLRHAEDSVAAVLWARRSKSGLRRESGAADLSSIQAEIGRLEPKPRVADVGVLLRQAQSAVERLAAARCVHFRSEVPPEPVLISTDPVLALQVLTNLLSLAAQQARPGTLRVDLRAETNGISLVLCFIPEETPSSGTIVNQVVAELAERLGWRVRQHDRDDDSRTVTLLMVAEGPSVLVIDDNEGLVELLDRYLTGHACRVLSASSGQQGLELAREAHPDAIVLDVMMPEMDGWELLQRLRAHASTTNTPVIICSVFNDPELAYSLGASYFLPKPVRRMEILEALRELGVV
jgi:CheY-like chemotaxis protein